MTDKHETKAAFITATADTLKSLAIMAAKANDYGPAEVVLSIAACFARASFELAREGKEIAALEDGLEFIRGAHDALLKDYAEAQRESAAVN